MRKLSIDLTLLTQWLLANKISLNATKTELIYFRGKRTPIPNAKFKLNGVQLQLFATDHIKYVEMNCDEYLTFRKFIKLLNAKLKKANNLLAISRHYVTKELLLQMYYGHIYSHLRCGCQLWRKNENAWEQTIPL